MILSAFTLGLTASLLVPSASTLPDCLSGLGKLAISHIGELFNFSRPLLCTLSCQSLLLQYFLSVDIPPCIVPFHISLATVMVLYGHLFSSFKTACVSVRPYARSAFLLLVTNVCKRCCTPSTDRHSPARSLSSAAAA